jgi:hypothetical protein
MTRDHATSDVAQDTSGASGFVATFGQAGDFAAYRAAEAWLAGFGYSVGRMQRGAPCGILRGDYDIQKWRNLSNAERRALDGTLSGNFRNGPVLVQLREGLAPAGERLGEPQGAERSEAPGGQPLPSNNQGKADD